MYTTRDDRIAIGAALGGLGAAGVFGLCLLLRAEPESVSTRYDESEIEPYPLVDDFSQQASPESDGGWYLLGFGVVGAVIGGAIGASIDDPARRPRESASWPCRRSL